MKKEGIKVLGDELWYGSNRVSSMFSERTAVAELECGETDLQAQTRGFYINLEEKRLGPEIGKCWWREREKGINQEDI